MDYAKHFFFFNPVTPPTGLHPLAYPQLTAVQGNPLGYMPPAYYRQYNHEAITGLVLALPKDGDTPTTAFSPTFGVMRLGLPSAAYWWSTLFPENGYGAYNADKVTFLNLSGCLQVLTQLGYPVTFGTRSVTTPAKFIAMGQVEQVLPWDEIQLHIAGDLTFPDTWNKYNVFKIHNWGKGPATVTFGTTHAVTVPAGGSRCVRRSGPAGTYWDGGKYYQAMLPGDPRFYHWSSEWDQYLGDATPRPAAPSHLQPMNLPLKLASNLGRTGDLRQLVDLKDAYAGAGLVGGVGMSTLIGDMMVMRGKFLAVRYSASGGVYGNPLQYLVQRPGFNGFAGIAALFAGLNPTRGVTWAYDATAGEITLNADGTDWGLPGVPGTAWGTRLELTDAESNLIFFLTGARKLTLPAGATTLLPPQGMLALNQRCKYVSTTTTFHWNSYSLDGAGYHLGDAISQTVTNRGLVVDVANTSCGYSFLDAPQKLADAMTAQFTGRAGVIKQFAVTLTPCGPALTWVEQYQIEAGFEPNYFQLGLLEVTGFEVNRPLNLTVSGRTLTVVRGQLLTGAGYNAWAPLDISNFNPPWHFPRVPRAVGAQRTVTHNGAHEPWQTATGSYTTKEPPNVINWYEWQPLRPLSCAGVQAAVTVKTGFSYLGPADQPLAGERPYAADSTGLLLYRWLAAGATDAQAYLRANFSAGFLPYGPANTPNEYALIEGAAVQIRSQAEQYNLCAGQANAIPVTPMRSAVAGKLAFGAADYAFPNYVPGGIPLPSGLTGTYWPRGCYYSWMAPATGTDALADYLAGLGLTVQTTLPAGFATVRPLYRLDYRTDGGTVSVLDSYADGFDPDYVALAGRYRWVTIDDVRALYNSLSLPFMIKHTLAPYKFKVAGSTATFTYGDKVPGTDVDGLGHPTGQPALNYLHEIQASGHCLRTLSPTADSDPASIVGTLGPTAQMKTGFVTDPEGEWVGPVPAGTVCVKDSPADNWGKINIGLNWPTEQNVAIAHYPGGIFVYLPDWVQNVEISWSDPPDYAEPVAPERMTQSVNAALLLCEGVANQCVACVPQNFAYYYPHLAAADPLAYFALGAAMIPVLANNTVESNPAEVSVIDGTGGAGGNEHLIQTGLANARLVIFDVDGGVGVVTNRTAADADTGAGETEAGAGDD